MQPIAGEQGTVIKGFIGVTDKIKVKFIQLATLHPLKEAAGNRHA